MDELCIAANVLESVVFSEWCFVLMRAKIRFKHAKFSLFLCLKHTHTRTRTDTLRQAPQDRLVKLWAGVKIRRWFRVLQGTHCSTWECEKSCSPHSVLVHVALFKLLAVSQKVPCCNFSMLWRSYAVVVFLNMMHESLNVWKAAHVPFLLRLKVKEWWVYTRSANKFWHGVFEWKNNCNMYKTKITSQCIFCYFQLLFLLLCHLFPALHWKESSLNLFT